MARLRLKGYKKVALRACGTFCFLLFTDFVGKFLLRYSPPELTIRSVLTNVVGSLIISVVVHWREFKSVPARNKARLR